MKRSVWLAGGLVAVVCAGVVAAHAVFSVSASAPRVQAPVVQQPATQDATAEILRAYLRHWEVFADAMRSLDASHLDEVFAGPALATISEQIANAAQAHTPAEIRVSQHRYRIKLISDVLASVDDTYLDQSNWIVVGAPSRPGEASWEHRTFTLSKEEGSWKVSDIISFSSSR